MFKVLKNLFWTIVSMPKDAIVFYKRGNLDFSGIFLFLRHPIPVKEAIVGFNAIITRDGGGKHYKLILKNIGISFLVRNINEFCLVCASFSNNCEYCFNIDGECIVIDVGANIGDTALYFASYKNVASVYAYEPFEDTFLQAKKNMALNPELAKKIKLFNFGLSDKDESREARYNFLQNGFNSVLDVPDNAPVKLKWDKDKSEVFCKEASGIIGEIVNSNKDKNIVLKMDCEGSEYEILESLDKSNLLKEIDIIMLEFHYRGSQSIEKTLTKNGFAVLISSPFGVLGQIGAVRTRKV
jgi:FkbM family methyltransferase